MDPVVALGLFIGIPLALVAVIALAVMVPRKYAGSADEGAVASDVITSAAAVPNPAALPSSSAHRREATGGAQGAFTPFAHEALTVGQRQDIQRVVQVARDICGFEFAVFVGLLANGRESVQALHARLQAPDSAVLVAVDPASGSMEIVTGSRVHRTLDDRTCEFALLTLRSSLQVNDVPGGVRDAVMLLAEHSRAPRTLHLDEPV